MTHGKRRFRGERYAVCRCGSICPAYPICRHPDFPKPKKPRAPDKRVIS